MNLIKPASIVILGMTLVACSSSPVPSSGGYTTAQAGTIQEVEYGTVVSVRNVHIEQESSDVGGAAGTIIGGVAGSEVGKGKGAIVGSVAGAVLGGVLGSKIDKRVQTKPGVEITVRLQSGKTVAISQRADEQFVVGQRVKVIKNNGKARVTR